MEDYMRKAGCITAQNCDADDLKVGNVYVARMYPRTGFVLYCGEQGGVKCFVPVNFPKDKNMFQVDEMFLTERQFANKIEWIYDGYEFGQDINALNDFVRTEMHAGGEGGEWTLGVGRNRPYIPWCEQEEIFLWQVFNPVVSLGWGSWQWRQYQKTLDGWDSEPWTLPYLPTNEEAFHQKPLEEFRCLKMRW